MHSEGILLGELKHGPLALIDEDMPIIMVIVKDHTYEKSFNAVQQVAARSVSAFTDNWRSQLSKIVYRKDLYHLRA